MNRNLNIWTPQFEPEVRAKTQNPKPKTQNPKPKTQNPKPKTQTQNPKTQTQNPKTHTLNQPASEPPPQTHRFKH